MLKIQLLIDNPNSWIVPYAKELSDSLKNIGHNTSVIHTHDDVEKGDILCLLACEKIFKNLDLNRHNLVVHESDLPKGKGWSPVTWQVLEGRNEIPVTLIEATKNVDAGIIYDKEHIILDGTELLEEIKDKQGEATCSLILKFVNLYPENIGKVQVGDSSFYKKRTPEDSELDISKSIDEQFNLLRVCDNERYPAFFWKKGIKYTIEITKND